MRTELFDSAGNSHAAAEFQSWLDANPRGYYINLRGPSNSMLHVVGCSHLGDPRDWPAGQADLCRNPKACNADRQALIAWAQESNRKFEKCGDCAP
jgi:hypothetical protein